ncbi:MAG: hypothetical protein ABL921_34620, partial [Pirellula sp.]
GHTPANGLYFGNDTTGNYELSIGNVSQSVLGRAYYSLDLTSVPVGATISLSYNYFVQTEGQLGLLGYYDRAIVNVSRDFSNAAFPIATVQSTQSALVDPSNGWRNVKVDLGQFQGTTVQIAFDFDSVDALYNNYEGFYIDDVNLRVGRVSLSATTNLAKIQGGANEIFGQSVASIGDLTGDGVPEFAAMAQGFNSRVLVFDGAARPWTAGLAYLDDAIKYSEVTGALSSGYSLTTAGNVIPDVTAPLPDILLSSISSLSLPAYVLSGAVLAQPGSSTAFTNAGSTLSSGYAVPLGNLDGLDVDDLGLVFAASSDNVAENGSSVKHFVGQVFLNSGITNGSLFSKPSLVVESGAPLYFSSTPASWFFGSLGDVNGDGLPDFAIADSLAGRMLSIYTGHALSNNPATTTILFASDVYQYELALPLPIVPADLLRRVNLSDAGVSVHSIGETAVIEGVTTNGRLGAPRSLGDINGDRQDDFAIESDQAYYIFYGPQSFVDADRIVDRADLIVNRLAIGTKMVTLAETLVNIDGDALGTNDLLFYNKVGTTLSFEIIYGSNLLPRDLNSVESTISDPAIIKHISFATTISAASTFNVFGVNWNGDSKGDIAAFTGSNSVGLPELTIFSGALLFDTPTIPASWGINSYYSSTAAPGYQASNLGDFNGDGLD